MPHVIEVEGLMKQYGETRAVQGISFTAEKGEIFGIVGPNGSGKTTTIEILEGLRKRDSGKVHVLDLDPGKESDRYQLNKKIGVQFQDTSIQELMKVKEALNLFASFYNTHQELKAIIEQLHLEDKLNSYFKDLSGGWKQRVTLALSVLHQPEIVFLDEPSMGLDPQARRKLWEVIHTLKEQGTTILVTTHYMEEAEKLCDRIAMVYDGRIRALGKPNVLLEDLATNYLAFESFDVDPDVLIALPSVIHMEKSRNRVRIQTENLQRSAYLVLKECEERDWKVTAFRFERGTLDDLFVHLLKERSA
ncbi:ABC transporter ATP-binding protein [Virgibacillus dakarensis]|uniref:ABC transporter ATP-binding protein n=1 Tax=Virgibacillus dakarensis TaxID=1917889 RepID=UPI000B447BB8|nr:ABC transporter ATP-binding protein [Virgibacillus dakarensis]